MGSGPSRTVEWDELEKHPLLIRYLESFIRDSRVFLDFWMKKWHQLILSGISSYHSNLLNMPNLLLNLIKVCSLPGSSPLFSSGKKHLQEFPRKFQIKWQSQSSCGTIYSPPSRNTDSSWIRRQYLPLALHQLPVCHQTTCAPSSGEFRRTDISCDPEW